MFNGFDQFIDISPIVNEDLAVWPGDQQFKRDVLLDFTKGDNLVLSSIKATCHVGAHADAPSHYHPNGKSIESRSLSHYLGSCQVICVNIARGERIQLEDIAKCPLRAPRVLFATGSFPDVTKWNDDFNSLSPDVIHYLADNEVFTVGIDTPSIDPFDSKALESHQAVYERDLAVLEGLDLRNVKAGSYQLVALPLRIQGAEASPVRAILLPEPK